MYKLSDSEVQKIIESEYNRQQYELEMIASENYVSKEVLMSYSNVFTNKYSEGYPGKRYYGGQKYVDEIELLAQNRALQLFGLNGNNWSVNVQPLSGSPSNLAVYLGLLNPGDTILGMDLDAGGHLSHGHKLSSAGIYYNIVSYGVKKDDGLIDYDEILEKALEYKPSMIIGGYSSYPREIDWEKFYEIANKVEEKHGYRPILLADIAHIAGLIAGGAMSSPFDYFDVVTTTTHKTLRGPRGAIIFSKKEYESSIKRGVFPGVQGGPHEHIIASKALAFGEALTSDFKNYAKSVVDNAKTLGDTLISKGWDIVTGGTDNHMIVLDVTHKNGNDLGITGKTAENVLEDIGISLNKNVVPFDGRSPMNPSGIRIGTPAVTTRGLGKNEMQEIGDIIDNALCNTNDQELLNGLKNRIIDLCERFPLQY